MVENIVSVSVRGTFILPAPKANCSVLPPFYFSRSSITLTSENDKTHKGHQGLEKKGYNVAHCASGAGQSITMLC